MTDPRCLSVAEQRMSERVQKEWRVECELADAAVVLMTLYEAETGLPISIISGYRSRAEQDRLRAAGRPAADDDISNHRVLPARALDFSLGLAPQNSQKVIFGRIATALGLRWGGGSPINPETGIPSDWNHLDMGRRPAGLPSGP